MVKDYINVREDIFYVITINTLSGKVLCDLAIETVKR